MLMEQLYYWGGGGGSSRIGGSGFSGGMQGVQIFSNITETKSIKLGVNFFQITSVDEL